MTYQTHAVIFDLDGTLVDSEPVYRQSERWLAEYLQVPFSQECSDDFIGLSTEEYMKWFREENALDMSVRELCDLQTRLFLEKGLQKVRPFSATVDFLKSLHINKLPIGLASGSEKGIIVALLERLRLQSYFHVALSSSEVGKSKPAPDVFQECAQRLDIAPQHCLVLEDSVPGMQAAQAADMPVITINSQPNSQAEQLSQADLQRLRQLQQADLHFGSMDEFNLMQILQQFDICQAV